MEIVNASHAKYDIIKHSAAFCVQCVLFPPKKREICTVLPKIGLTFVRVETFQFTIGVPAFRLKVFWRSRF